MKRNRLIFYAVFAVFHLFLVFFTIYVESNKNDFSFLTQMLKYISVMKYGAFVGLILLVVDVLWDRSTVKESEKQKDALTHELNTLKAKLFDLQEAAKVAPSSKELK
jgi:hypothetical protein